jgi:hypothetical protein
MFVTKGQHARIRAMDYAGICGTVTDTSPWGAELMVKSGDTRWIRYENLERISKQKHDDFYFTAEHEDGMLAKWIEWKWQKDNARK